MERLSYSLSFVYPQISTPTPYSWSSNFFPPKLLTSWHGHVLLTWIHLYSNLRPLLFAYKVDDQVYHLKLCPFGRFSLITVFPSQSWMRLQCCPFSAWTPLLTDPSANQAWAFPSAFILPFLVISWERGAGATLVGYLLMQVDRACCSFVCLILGVSPPSHVRLSDLCLSGTDRT